MKNIALVLQQQVRPKGFGWDLRRHGLTFPPATALMLIRRQTFLRERTTVALQQESGRLRTFVRSIEQRGIPRMRETIWTRLTGNS
jgi:hypothetical protein